MNAHESEKLEAVLASSDYEKTENTDAADIIVFNTCCIRAGAENRTLSNIGALLKYKKKNPGLKIAVCGCMPQKKDSLEKLKTRFPYIDIIFGTHNLHEFKEALEKSADGRVINVWESEGGIIEGQQYLRAEGNVAWVNIMFGCDNYCSYCVVPYVRGRERSRRAEDIISEAGSIVKEGKYGEICLLGQNVNSYRGTYRGEAIDFARLLELLAAVPGEFKLTFMTPHPKDLSDGVIGLLASNAKLKKSVHLPVQSGSDKILSAMNRKYTKAEYLALAGRIRAAVPGVILTSDIIVGFPGEAEEDYNETLDLVTKVRFDNLYMFMFSAREGTPARSLQGQLPLEVKRGRLLKLIALQRRIQKEMGNGKYGCN